MFVFFRAMCYYIISMEEKERVNLFLKRNFYTTTDVAKVFLFALLLPILFSVIFSYIGYGIASIAGVNFGEESFVTVLYENYLWFSIPYCLISQITFVCMFFIYNKINKISFSACKLKVKKLNVTTTILSALLGIILVIGFYGLIEGCFKELFSLGGMEVTNTPIPLDNFWWYLLNLLIFAVIPAFCEELIFRGVMYNGLKRGIGKVGAIFLSSLLFALLHQNIAQFIFPFIMGIVLSVVVEKTGNLFYAMIIHLFSNITTLTIEFLININALNLPTEIGAVYIVVSIILALVVSALFVLFYFFYLKKQKVEEEKEVGEVSENSIFFKKLPLLLYFGILLAVIVIVINAVI